MPIPLFNEELHKYTTPGGQPLPGVTTILGEYRKTRIGKGEFYVALDGTAIEAEVMRKAAEIGSAVHKCLQYALTYGPGRFTYPEEIAPCVDQIWQWRQDFSPEVLAVETPLYSERYLFAGTLDLVCRIGGKLCMVDAKTGMGALVGPQTAAYETLYREDTGCQEPMERWLLQLPRDGAPYRFKRLANPNDWNFFKARMFCHHYLKGA
jgi:hypothetical protein